MRTVEEAEKLLDEKIPRDVISTRDGGGGRKLSYLETHYVIDRMNKVFGNMGWDSETVDLKAVDGGDHAAYTAKVRVKAMVKVGDGFLTITKEGTGYGRDKSKLNPHEMAVKEAESDAFKRAAMKFGMSLGLALYSKDQENVEDAPKIQSRSERDDARGETEVVTPAPVPQQVGGKSAREKTNRLITNTSKVIMDKKLKTREEILSLLETSFGVKTKEELTDVQANDFLTKLREILK